MTDITKEEVRERLGNIDQIRDIIFGAQLRDYDNRIGKVESDIVLLQQQMRDRLEKLEQNLTQEIRVTADALDRKLKAIDATTQEDAADLRQHVDRLNKRFTASLQTLDSTVDEQTASLRGELHDTRNKLHGEVGALRDLVLEELDRRFSQLREAKVSRDDIAEALFELGMRLKGAEFIPSLKEAAGNGTDDVLPLLRTRKYTEELSHV